MKKRNIMIIAGFIVCLILIVKIMNRFANPDSIVNRDTIILNAKKQVYFSEFGERDFTCTGMTFDNYNNSFWIADYGRIEKNDKLCPRIIEVSNNFDKVLSEISLESLAFDESFNLQGIAYDKRNNSLWIATGENVYEIDKSGNVLIKIYLDRYANNKSNGIAVDGDIIWLLCYKKNLLKYSCLGELEKVYYYNFRDQDHICVYNDLIYSTVGADYLGNKNYVFTFNPLTEEIRCKYIISDSHSIEGITIVDGIMYIANDGKYHRDVFGKSYISMYTIDVDSAFEAH